MGITDVGKIIICIILAAGAYPLGALVGYLFPDRLLVALLVACVVYSTLTVGIAFWMRGKDQ